MDEIQSVLPQLIILNCILYYEEIDTFVQNIEHIKRIVNNIDNTQINGIHIKNTIDIINKSIGRENIDLKKYHYCIRYFKKNMNFTNDIVSFFNMDRTKLLDFNYIKDIAKVDRDRLIAIFSDCKNKLIAIELELKQKAQ